MFQAQQNTARRLVERVTTDDEVVHLLGTTPRRPGLPLGPAPNREDADQAIRGLSANNVLYFRYYGAAGVDDIGVS